MKLKRKSDGKVFNLRWPKILPTAEQMQENDMTGIFCNLEEDGATPEALAIHPIIYAPFADNFDYELINEEGDTPWTISKQ
jgi:hypothetical protein